MSFPSPESIPGRLTVSPAAGSALAAALFDPVAKSSFVAVFR
jgi:hypothetical protein